MSGKQSAKDTKSLQLHLGGSHVTTVFTLHQAGHNPLQPDPYYLRFGIKLSFGL